MVLKQASASFDGDPDFAALNPGYMLDCLRSRAKRQWPEIFRESSGPKMPQSAKNFVWLAVLFIVALLFATITFHYLDNYAGFTNRGMVWVLVLFMIAPPLLWGVALGTRWPLLPILLNVHAALLSVYILVNIAFSPDGRPQAIIVLGFFLAIIGADAFIARIASVRMKKSRRDINHPKFVYLGLTAFIFSGCFIGVQIWSPTVPPRIIAAAETTAADRPYCIEVDGRPARNAGELTGLSMGLQDEFTLNFRALLVIETSRPHDAKDHITPGEIHQSGKASFGEWKPPDRNYLNWSYRSGRFEPVSGYAREGLHLDSQVKCMPVAHFARDWG
jgi:hypothetical protein